MERALVVFTLFLMAVVPVYVSSSRFLLGDETSNTTSEKIVGLPPEGTPPIKTEKSSLTSLKSDSQNQSGLQPPVQPELEKNQSQESSPPVEPDKKDKTENNNSTVLSPPEIKKPKNDTETGAETKNQGQIGNLQHYLCDDVASEKCYDENKWVACLQSSNNSKELFLLVENKGQNEISLDINFTPSIILHTKKLHLSKTDSRKVKIIKTDSNQAANITLNSGKGDCILHINPSKTLISDLQIQFQQLTNYASAQITPIYGLYFLLFTLAIFLITFACCKCTKGRGRNPNGGSSGYLQLEMGERGESASSARVADVAETADGWERGWDDDWDDEETGRGVSVNNNIVNNNVSNDVSNNNNNNGISSKDGWDVDWDD